MIKRSTFNRIIFFVTVSISYLSYRVIQNMFIERGHNEAKEVYVTHNTREVSSIPYKKLEESSFEAPFSKTIDLEDLPKTSYRSSLTISSKIRNDENIGVIEKRTIKHSKANTKSQRIIATGAGGYQQGATSYNRESDSYNSGYGGGVSSGGGAQGGGSTVFYAESDGSGKFSGIEMGEGLALNAQSGTNISSSVSTVSSSLSSTSGNGSSARLGISASNSNTGNSGISTTPPIGGTNTPVIQAPPPPPPPAPIDTNSIIFILVGTAMGTYMLLKNSKNTATKSA